MQAEAEHVLIVRLGHGQALVQVQLGHVQAEAGGGVVQQAFQRGLVLLAALAEGGQGRDGEAAGHEGGEGRGGRLHRRGTGQFLGDEAVRSGHRGGQVAHIVVHRRHRRGGGHLGPGEAAFPVLHEGLGPGLGALHLIGLGADLAAQDRHALAVLAHGGLDHVGRRGGTGHGRDVVGVGDDPVGKLPAGGAVARIDPDAGDEGGVLQGDHRPVGHGPADQLLGFIGLDLGQAGLDGLPVLEVGPHRGGMTHVGAVFAGHFQHPRRQGHPGQGRAFHHRRGDVVGPGGQGGGGGHEGQGRDGRHEADGGKGQAVDRTSPHHLEIPPTLDAAS